LPVTHRDFVEFGIHDHAVAPGLREVEALGLIEIKRGRAGNAEFRRPSLLRLTYRPSKGKRETNEWRHITSIERAEEVVARARQAITKRPAKFGRRRKHFPLVVSRRRPEHSAAGAGAARSDIDHPVRAL
jgi:hypothetical protein